MTRKLMTWFALAAVVVVAPLMAQPAPNPMTGTLKSTFDRVRNYITQAAEQTPEADYAFKPTPDVRSFGQLVAHVADGNFMMCAAVAGGAPPATSVEKTMTTKADIQKALADSFAYCEKVYAGMTDATGLATVSFFGGTQPKLGVLAFVNNHDFEHYGNIVTYMRLKGRVPPSSQRPGM